MSTAEFLAQKFYAPKDAAPLMQIKLDSLYALIRAGKIKTSQGKTKLIAESEIARYMGMEPVASTRQKA